MCAETNRMLEASADYNLITKAVEDYKKQGRGVKIVKM